MTRATASRVAATRGVAQRVGSSHANAADRRGASRAPLGAAIRLCCARRGRCRRPKPGSRSCRPFLPCAAGSGRFGGTLTLAVLAGVLAGLAAVALRTALHFASGALVGRFADLGGPEILQPPARRSCCFPVLGGLASGVFVQGLLRIPPAHGTHQLVHAFHRRDGVLPLRGPAARALACVGVIACGGSAGPEGPIAGLGAAIGSSLGRAFALTPRARRTLLVAGCAAGVGAIFRCPLGGALFACSVLYRRPELEGSALVAAFIASAVGYATFTSFTGFGGFLLEDADRLAFASALELPVYVALGVACGVDRDRALRAVKRTEAAFAGLGARAALAAPRARRPRGRRARLRAAAGDGRRVPRDPERARRLASSPAAEHGRCGVGGAARGARARQDGRDGLHGGQRRRGRRARPEPVDRRRGRRAARRGGEALAPGALPRAGAERADPGGHGRRAGRRRCARRSRRS